jgi:hypothetical protein
VFKKFLDIYGIQSSLSFPQEPDTWLYDPDPGESNLQFHVLFIWDPFYYYRPIYA